ncbi:MAG: LEA/WHy family protein [Myxococcaceae bacterium]
MKRALPLLLLLAIALPGCAALSKLFASAFKKPTFAFKSVTLGDISLTGVTLNLTYTLDNPNALGIKLAQADYALFVEGHQVVAGKPPNGLQIPARGKVDLVFPANVKFADVAPVLQVFLQKDFAQYRAEGRVGVQTPIGVLSFPIVREDRFEVPKMPTVQFGAPRITNLSFSSATLDIPLSVTNRNSFNLPVSGLSGAVNINGASVGQVSTGDMGALTGGASREVSVPLTVNFASALQAANAIRQGSGNVGFSGSLQSGSGAIPLSFNQNLAFRR